MSDLRARLRTHIDTGLAVARAAAEDSPPWHLNDWASRPYVAFMRLFNPAAIIAWLEGESEVLERHTPNEDRECRTCLCPTGSTYQDNPIAYREDWPCSEIKSLAHRLGVSVDGR